MLAATVVIKWITEGAHAEDHTILPDPKTLNLGCVFKLTSLR